MPDYVQDNYTNLDAIYLVFEFYDLNMSSLMSNKQINIDFEQLVILAYNFLCGINFLHTSNVLHRDLKPANLLITLNCCVKICDFGLSRTMRFDTVKKSGNQRIRRERLDMSPVCYSRWYRPPEVILEQPNYNEKADVWSFGCIIAELLFTLDNKNKDKKHKILFKGDSCYPFSPLESEGAETISFKDQIVKICNVINTSDRSFIKDQASLTYMDQIEEIKDHDQSLKFKQVFANYDPKFVDLISKALVFNPEKRHSVKDLLKHSLFDKIRNPVLEDSSPIKISLKCDTQEYYEKTGLI